MIKCELCGNETEKFNFYRVIDKSKKIRKTITKRYCTGCYAKTGQRRGKGGIIVVKHLDGRDSH